jgi:2-pyrone-4,6-dicarboxylate lactonase
LHLPPGASDAHVHVFGPVATFPFAPERRFTPAEAPRQALAALHAALGVERCVVVQSSAHGFDNAVTEDALRARPGARAGVALLPFDVADTELHRLDAAGFRGVRFHFARHLGVATPIDEMLRFAGRLVDIGWHLQLHFESAWIHTLAPALKRSPVPVVIDHMARVDASLGLDHADFRALRELLRDDHIWVKVSGIDRVSRAGPPYADAVPFARALIEDAPGRVLWGTDWPHPNHSHVPDDAALVDRLPEFAPSMPMRQALLVDNPASLYRFSAP